MKRSKVFRWCGYGVGGFVLLIVIGIVVQYTISAQERSRFPPIGQMINVGGYKLHLYCMGEGKTTILMEAGIGDNVLIWDNVLSQIAKTTRVCAYDRAGMGWSDPSPKLSNSQQHIVALRRLLDAANINAPYILVGHSFGGILNREFARTYPGDIDGMVLIDSAHENQLDRLPPEIVESFKKTRNTLGLLRSIASFGVLRLISMREDWAYPNNNISHMMRALDHRTCTIGTIYQEIVLFEKGKNITFQPGSLGNIPLIVLTQGKPLSKQDLPGLSPTAKQAFRETWNKLQQELTTLSSNSIQIIAQKSGHLIMIDEPELVIDAVLRVFESSKNKSQLLQKSR